MKGVQREAIFRAPKEITPEELAGLDPQLWPATPYENITVEEFTLARFEGSTGSISGNGGTKERRIGRYMGMSGRLGGGWRGYALGEGTAGLPLATLESLAM